jgi:protein-tyrosine phosphatase
MRYEFQGIDNVRDLGGLKRADGRAIKDRLLFRTAGLHNASAEDIKRLVDEFHISSVIDLRDDMEVESEPDTMVPGAAYYHIPAMAPMLSQLLEGREPGDLEKLRVELMADPQPVFDRTYSGLATSEESEAAYRRFFEILLEAGGKPVLWHCTQGKDRTGIATFLLMLALGFSQDAAIAEYLATNDFMQGVYDKMVTSGSEEDELSSMRVILFANRANLELYVRKCAEKYGSVAAYIRDVLHVGDEQVVALEKAYMN